VFGRNRHQPHGKTSKQLIICVSLKLAISDQTLAALWLLASWSKNGGRMVALNATKVKETLYSKAYNRLFVNK
jgi:hypothetical protein